MNRAYTIEEIANLVSTSEEYNFLNTNPKLGENGKGIVLIGLGGSYAYGTNKTDGTSDVDIRGIALNSKSEILLGQDFEQVINEETDTTIYSFNKIIKLLYNCNPNVIEILGLKPEHYLYMSDIGKELYNNRKIFLSLKAVETFGGYATAQLRRLDNKSNRLVGQAENEKHILNSILCASIDFPERYFYYDEDSINLYVDKAIQKGYDSEIFMDINLTHYPLRDYACMMSEMNNIIKEYSKIGKRNANAILHNKIGKHMMHLIRLYLMAFDILEKEEINTYRENDIDFLMSIRNGKFLDSNSQPVPEFYDMVNEYEKRLQYDRQNSSLPLTPDLNKINEFTMYVNERIVKGLC